MGLYQIVTLKALQLIQIKTIPRLMIVLLFIFLLLGCTSRPSFEEGDAQLQLSASLARLDIVKATIGGFNQTTDNVPDYLKESPPILPDSELLALREFLKVNNCSVPDGIDYEQCYRLTVIYLINLANRTDQTGDELYGAKVTVQSLIEMLDRIHRLLTESG